MWYPVVRVVRASPAFERSSRVEPLTERVTPVFVRFKVTVPMNSLHYFGQNKAV